MPELPEVETVRSALAPATIGKKILRVTINRYDLRFPIPANFIEVTQAQKITKTHRRGKYILITLERGNTIILHLGMSGRIAIHASTETYTPQKHDHAVLTLNDGTIITFNDPRRFGMLLLTNDNEHWENHKLFAQMGPEPLGNHFNGPLLASALKNKTSTIKSALLDQRIVSGIGNIYACEALYDCRINPDKKAGSIKGAKAEALAASIKATLAKAIKAGGSSLKDYKHTDGSLGYFQTMFHVYGRENEPCHQCAAPIKRITQSGRSTFYCSSCQK